MINRIFAPTFAALFAALVIYGFVPPPQRAVAFDAQSTWGGTSGGTANAQTVTIANMGPGDLLGVPFRFIPGFTNTGPATLTVSGNAAQGLAGTASVFRRSSIGNVALSGQELLAGEMAEATYQPGGYFLLSGGDMTPIGKTVDFRGSAAPRGTLIEDGSCISQTTYAPLFSVIGTQYGSCSAGLFKLPFSNGEGFVAMDNQGAATANRITSAGSGCNATAVGDCGSQNQTLSLAQLPSGITSGVGGSFSGSGSGGTSGANIVKNATLSNLNAGGATFFGAILNNGTGIGDVTVAVNVSGSISGSATSNNTGGAAHPILNPISLGIRAIKY